jgi:hypothetical protein
MRAELNRIGFANGGILSKEKNVNGSTAEKRGIYKGEYLLTPSYYGDMSMNRIFRFFCTHRFGIGLLHNLLSHSDIGFEIAEIL